MRFVRIFVGVSCSGRDDRTGVEQIKLVIFHIMQHHFSDIVRHVWPFVIYTATCTLVQSAVLRLYVVCPSVCLSVTLVNHDHIMEIVELTARTISPTSSLFVAQRPSTDSYRNMGKFGETRSGYCKVACWSTKAAISLKRVKIDEKLLWGPIETRCGFPFPRLGFASPT